MFSRLLLLCTAAIAACAACAAPCITTSSNCTEWVTLGGGPGRSLIYRSYPIASKNEQITRALIVIHGAGRNADDYFRTGVAAAFLAGALDNTIIVSPRFASKDRGCNDALASNEVSWSCGGDSWRSGGVASSDDHLNSYELTDEILRKLARKEIFPNLKAIVVAGHSAGGQYVTRYEMSNKVHDTLGVAVTYVVSNPSSYAWPDATRPVEDSKDYRPYRDARNCTTYDRWPYGFLNRGAGYTGNIPDDQLKKQLAARPVTYLLGELDVMPVGGFDSSCPAMAQGLTRRARGEAFAKYVNEKYGARHKVVVVPLCGHNARCMFTADLALPILFPAP